MTDETDTTSEVARVLIEHTRLTFDGKCHCGFQGRLGESFTAHQAEALAEAGLLRDEKAIADLGQSIIALLDQIQRVRTQAEGWAAKAPEDDWAEGGIGETALADAGRAILATLGAVSPEEAQIATQEPAGGPVAPPEGVGTSGTLSGRLRAEAEAGRVGQHARLSAIADEAERTERARDLYRADANGMLQQKDQWRDAANTAEAQVERVRALAQWFRDQGQTGYARKVQHALEMPCTCKGAYEPTCPAHGDGHTPEPQHEHKWVFVTTYDARGLAVQQCTIDGCGVERDMATGGVALGLPTTNPFRPEDRAPVNDWAKVDHTADQCQFEECPSCGCCAHGKEHVIGCSTTLDRPLGTECPNSDCACKGGMG